MALEADTYAPRWLRLHQAVDVLKNRGLSSDDAKAGLTRWIQDQLNPRSLPGMFRLPHWRHSPHFRGLDWVTTPVIDWENSTIKAPHSYRMRRVPGNYPTLIEVSAAGLDREFQRRSD